MCAAQFEPSVRNRWERWSLALVCVLLAGLSGCAVLPGAGMPFPEEGEGQLDAAEAPVGPGAEPMAQVSQAPPLEESRPEILEPQRPALPPLEPLVVTQLDEAMPLPVLDEEILSLLLSEPVAVVDLLRLLLRETDISLVPDAGIDETFRGELKNVTLRQALDLVLRPFDLDYRVEHDVLRVYRRPLQTRVFELNFVTTRRVANRRVSAGFAEGAASRTEFVLIDDGDFFAELDRAVRPLLSAGGRAHVDRGAGLLQVTDLPERVDAVGQYLDRVVRRAGRQVRIEAHIMDVALADTASAGLDLLALSRSVPALRGIDGSAIQPVLATRAAVDQFLAVLEQQGVVTTLARPTVVTMNNQPVIIRVDTRGLPVEASTGVMRSVGAGGRPLDDATGRSGRSGHAERNPERHHGNRIGAVRGRRSRSGIDRQRDRYAAQGARGRDSRVERLAASGGAGRPGRAGHLDRYGVRRWIPFGSHRSRHPVDADGD